MTNFELYRLDPIHPEGQGHSPENVELDSLMVQLRETCLFELESFLQVSRTYNIRAYFYNNVIFPGLTDLSNLTKLNNKSYYNKSSTISSKDYCDSDCSSNNYINCGYTELTSSSISGTILDAMNKAAEVFPHKPGIILGRSIFDASIDYFITVDNITDHTYQVYKVSSDSKTTLVNSFNFNDLIVFILDWRLENTL